MSFGILAFISFMVVTGAQVIFHISFCLTHGCHRSTYDFQHWLSSHACLSHEHRSFSILAFVSLMFVTGAPTNFHSGFRCIPACHKSTCHFQYWLSSHSCLSQDHKQFSRLAFVSLILVTRAHSIFNTGFRIIPGFHKTPCHLQCWFSSRSCLSQKHKLFSILAFVSLIVVTGAHTIFSSGLRVIHFLQTWRINRGILSEKIECREVMRSWRNNVVNGCFRPRVANLD